VRILSLGHRLMHPNIDNHNIFNAPAILDYEAIVIDVAATAQAIHNAVSSQEAFQTHADVPVANGESIDGVTGIADTLRRRHDELTRALERGAAVIVFTDRPGQISGVAGYQGLDRYFFLPAPTGMAWDSITLRGGEGSTLAVTDPAHPTVDLMETYRRSLLYRAYFNDRAPGFAGNARVIGRSEGGAPIAVEFSVLNGRVIFLPTPQESGVRWLIQSESDAIIVAFNELLQRSDEAAPSWVVRTPLPGLEDLEREQGLRIAAASHAEDELAEARSNLRDHAVLRDVLWRTGDHGLSPSVIACAQQLGFTSKESPEGDPILLDGDDELHLVVAGSEEAVDMAPHYRLRTRLDTIIERSSKPARGLIVANGQRLTRPEERKRETTESLRVAAESVGYAVITARDLFAAASATLDGLDELTQAAIRTRLRTTDGVVTLNDLLGTEDAPEAATEEAPAAKLDSENGHGPADETEDAEVATEPVASDS
jgi:hypothetical protein